MKLKPTDSARSDSAAAPATAGVNTGAANQTGLSAQEKVLQLEAELQEMQSQVQQARDSERRALADYQNVLRRQSDERSKLVKLATQELVVALLQPLDHLSLAASQLNDPGLHMVVKQFWQTLSQYGVEELQVIGQAFDPQTMEAVQKEGEGETVLAVAKRGYTLNGQVIQVAKVVVGDSVSSSPA